MKFLYKLSLLNENEIRNGLQPRCIYVVASSMADAITCYSEDGSMISACEFMYPVVIV